MNGGARKGPKTIKWNHGDCDQANAAERARRIKIYEEALASVRLEGFELSTPRDSKAETLKSLARENCLVGLDGGAFALSRGRSDRRAQC